eukprot:358446-Chlamydomonas_euryale.AAC.2
MTTAKRPQGDSACGFMADDSAPTLPEGRIHPCTDFKSHAGLEGALSMSNISSREPCRISTSGHLGPENLRDKKATLAACTYTGRKMAVDAACKIHRPSAHGVRRPTRHNGHPTWRRPVSLTSPGCHYVPCAQPTQSMDTAWSSLLGVHTTWPNTRQRSWFRATCEYACRYAWQAWARAAGKPACLTACLYNDRGPGP